MNTNYQNLNLELDLTVLNDALRSKSVDVRTWNDQFGREHKSVIIFITKCKDPTAQKSHNVCLKDIDAWKSATINGKIVYCGKASLSKFQPNERQAEVYTPENNDGTVKLDW